VKPDPSERSLSLASSALAAGICALWGANTVAIKYSLEGFGPFTAAAVRFGLSLALLWVWAAATGRSLRPAAGSVRPLVVNAILFALQLALVYVAFTYTSASHGALITNLQPFMLLFLAHFFLTGDRITVLKLAGLVLGCAGAVCVFMDREGASDAVMLGDLLLLGATAVWAGSAAYTKHLVRNISSVQIVFYQLLFSIPLFGLAAPLLDAPMVGRVGSGVVIAVGFQVLLTTGFAFVAWTRLMEIHGAVALHAFVFLIPVAGVISAGLILDEPVTPMTLAALVLITAGILLVQLGQRREAAALRDGKVRP
jgi:drug/metabolite transporter (DMT)-like permease